MQVPIAIISYVLFTTNASHALKGVFNMYLPFNKYMLSTPFQAIVIQRKRIFKRE